MPHFCQSALHILYSEEKDSLSTIVCTFTTILTAVVTLPTGYYSELSFNILACGACILFPRCAWLIFYPVIFVTNLLHRDLRFSP